jgi:hypothetical protein
LPDFFLTLLGGTVLTNEFWNGVDNLHFCIVNTSVVLEKSKWRLFSTLFGTRAGAKNQQAEKNKLCHHKLQFYQLTKANTKRLTSAVVGVSILF